MTTPIINYNFIHIQQAVVIIEYSFQLLCKHTRLFCPRYCINWYYVL